MLRLVRSCAAGLVLLAFAALPVAAQAVTKVLTWDAVTTCVGGTPCTPSVYSLYRQVVAGGVFVKLADITPPLVTYTDPSVPVGAICYRVTASSAANAESAPSNTLCITVAPAMSAPSNLR